jgi:hypothetical protein
MRDAVASGLAARGCGVQRRVATWPDSGASANASSTATPPRETFTTSTWLHLGDRRGVDQAAMSRSGRPRTTMSARARSSSGGTSSTSGSRRLDVGSLAMTVSGTRAACGHDVPIARADGPTVRVASDLRGQPLVISQSPSRPHGQREGGAARQDEQDGVVGDLLLLEVGHSRWDAVGRRRRGIDVVIRRCSRGCRRRCGTWRCRRRERARVRYVRIGHRGPGFLGRAGRCCDARFSRISRSTSWFQSMMSMGAG